MDLFRNIHQNELLLVTLACAIGLFIFLFFHLRNQDFVLKRMQSGRWLRTNYIWIVIGFGCILVAAAIILYVGQLPSMIHSTVDALQATFDNTPEDDEKLRNLAYAFAALAGALTIMATIPFQLIRIWLNERSTRTAEQSHITDQINKAVEGLGAQRAVKDEIGEHTLPNVEVRIGAIYALERIGQDSSRDHIQIMEILTAYIRENSPSTGSEPYSTAATFQIDHESDPPNNTGFRDARASAKYARFDPDFYDNLVWIWGRNLTTKTDIQIVAQVIGRRNSAQCAIERIDKRYGEYGYSLDLRKSNLQGVDISRLNFLQARLSETFLDGADLSFANLQNVDFRWSEMKGAKLEGARLGEADLGEANLESADLTCTNLAGTKLHEAHLQNSDLSWANACGADFSHANLQGADLSNISFDNNTNWTVSSSKKAAFHATDFSRLTDISPLFFEEAFGDASVKLPPGLQAGQKGLSHWPTAKLERREFYKRWRDWQSQQP